MTSIRDGFGMRPEDWGEYDRQHALDEGVPRHQVDHYDDRHERGQHRVTVYRNPYTHDWYIGVSGYPAGIEADFPTAIHRAHRLATAIAREANNA